MDRIRNEYIRGQAHVTCFGDKVREARLRWFVHVQRTDNGYINRRMLRLEPAGRSLTGRPNGKFKDVMKEDMKLLGVKVEDPEDGTKWRQMILFPFNLKSLIFHALKSSSHVFTFMLNTRKFNFKPVPLSKRYYFIFHWQGVKYTRFYTFLRKRQPFLFANTCKVHQFRMQKLLNSSVVKHRAPSLTVQH